MPAASRALHAWLHQADGMPACYSLALAPLRDAAGRSAGLRGIGRDVTAEVRAAEQQAAELRRGQALETLVRRVRRQVLPPRMLAAMLEALPPALGCAGAAVLEMGLSGLLRVIQRHGEDPGPLLAAVGTLLNDDVPSYADGAGREILALLPHPQRRVPRQALLAWRAPGGRPFDADDRHLLASRRGPAVRRDGQPIAAAGAGIAGAHGCADRAAEPPRLPRGPGPAAGTEGHGPDPRGGAVLFIDLDNFKPLNDRMGHEAGDAALIAVARLLRDIVRPTDLVARFGGDEFAVWLQDADAEAAAMRAGAMCRTAVVVLPGLIPGCTLPLTFSIGGAVRVRRRRRIRRMRCWPGRMPRCMRPSAAGRNGWRLAPEPRHAAPPAAAALMRGRATRASPRSPGGAGSDYGRRSGGAGWRGGRAGGAGRPGGDDAGAAVFPRRRRRAGGAGRGGRQSRDAAAGGPAAGRGRRAAVRAAVGRKLALRAPRLAGRARRGGGAGPAGAGRLAHAVRPGGGYRGAGPRGDRRGVEGHAGCAAGADPATGRRCGDGGGGAGASGFPPC